MKFKQFGYGIYGIGAVALVVVGFVVFWILLTTVDVAIVPVSGVSSPIVIPTPRFGSEVRSIEVGGQKVYAAVADTEVARQKGLSGRSGLAPDEGMLFVFPQDGKYAFWMKDMRFSIDIVWLSRDGAVVYMVQNASPDTYPRDFVPREPARYVLELPAGFVSRNNVAIGDIVRL